VWLKASSERRLEENRLPMEEKLFLKKKKRRG